ncbi:2-oxo-4-hydroxy-4-carboxy-5-ureidoimidazoline decarboxylase-like [Saccoglossus kowalevskii]|uniref:2-oxo-4-hydroxy-4-carboxy-5-ureidoimidazoline decarboxylase n=1 Tax=Saccoglossus kowalevskii TaxID=10224 RepID=A0A0U2U2L5_SACKO|nr:PREDICTED: 2-oxo-4-hydroxy-4-carboxy-5-ureidoimidazoline decarboxylase-like [Saccoglossus kowalevskii]ALR88636.1 neighbor of parahox 2-oxo-4-hydroxy-4-carboxy-5-ureidoimidazoline decarboxylase-like [Saccoglossus kowalevskii]
MRISDVNQLEFDEFTSKFGNVIEHATLITAAVWSERPFRSLTHLHDEICKFIDTLPDTGKAGILRCHPDLAGKLSQAGTLTSESTKEQSGSGLLSLTEDERNYLQQCNAKYRNKFGFPFVICARENKKDAIMKGFKTRLDNSMVDELNTGIREVKKIGWYRLLDLVDKDSHL